MNIMGINGQIFYIKETMVLTCGLSSIAMSLGCPLRHVGTTTWYVSDRHNGDTPHGWSKTLLSGHASTFTVG
jgi:hypothetical protein